VISQRLSSVRERIANAAERAGRNSEDVELVIVTKFHPVELVAELVDLGERNFGENKDQEASAKSDALSLLRSDVEVNWHFVGQLQSNKVKSVLRYASTIHSLDRDSLLAELKKQLEKTDQTVGCFIELNLTDDPGRGGLEPSNLGMFAEKVLAVPQINLLGVMAVAGLGVDPRVDFEKAVGASEELRSISPESRYLSMGMSEDFELAVELGATHVRVGSAITGPRG
jgi:pyridoxal phosphate enzyme (YggS family)